MEEANVSCPSETHENKKQEEKLLRQDFNNIIFLIQYIESVKKMAVSDELKNFLSKIQGESENMKWEIMTQNIYAPLNQSPELDDDAKIQEVIKALGDIDSRERITLLYMAIDYVYMNDGKLTREHKELVTKH